jgi:hypothetical protein
MKIKKLLCVVMALCLAVLSLSSCSRINTYAFNISGAKVPESVYAYFLDLTAAKPEEYGLVSSAGENELKEKSLELCKEYVAVNSLFKELGLTLFADQKESAASNVTGLWRLYSGHYTAIDVTKQTLNKIESSLASKDRLLMHYFDDKTKAVSEDEIKTYFSQNYIAFRAINGYLTKTAEDGSTVDLTPEETAALKSKFESLAVKISDGENFDSVEESFNSEQGISSETTGEITLITKDSASHPKGFFEEAAKLAAGVPGIIQVETYIFLVVREDVLAADDEYLIDHRDIRLNCLYGLKGAELNQTIASAAADYTVEKNNRVINRVYETVIENRNSS